MFDAKTKILVLDDMASMRRMIVNALKTLGFENIIQASDGRDGWSQLEGAVQPVGLIVCDWDMPHVSGFELLERVKADDRFKNIPFVFLTGGAEAERVSEAIRLGVSHYILKPFTIEQLRQKLEQVHSKLK